MNRDTKRKSGLSQNCKQEEAAYITTKNTLENQVCKIKTHGSCSSLTKNNLITAKQELRHCIIYKSHPYTNIQDRNSN